MIERHFVRQGIKRLELEEFLKKELDRAGFTRSDIVKTPLVTRIVVNVTHPGLAIGKSGQNIRRLTKEIEEKFQIDNPQLEIKEIEVPELDAQAMADKMANLLTRGYSWRSVAYRTLRDIVKAGAVGVEISLGGVLAGKGQRKRSQRIAEGYMKKVGEQTRLVDYAKADSYPKFGAIGIKIRIVKPNTQFTDKVNIEEILAKRSAAAEAAAPQTLTPTVVVEAEAVKEIEAEKVEEKKEIKYKAEKKEHKAKEKTEKEETK
ncbi:MAG: 30S ribosomal protein S3 [archaeon]|nr:30S ribosomal protein S3 [archaeon]